ncbi:MAG: hypothetical protein WDN28_15430 [Chthoniobacter sp.]
MTRSRTPPDYGRRNQDRNQDDLRRLGAKDAERDAKKMEALGKGNGGRGSLATPPPDLNTPLPPSKQEQTAAAASRPNAARR